MEARKQLGLPEDETILLTGAVGAVKDERKGFHLLVEALRKCRQAGGTDKWRLLVFGANSGPSETTVGIQVSYRGTVRTEADLPRIYQAADAFVIPSVQDNLPNTVLEALACGKPVVGFRSSGVATMIKDGCTGRLAEPFSVDSLAKAIHEVLATECREEWNAACRANFETLYAWPGPALQYIRLYEDVLRRSAPVDRV
jgi:glycosyltransferase involved in cell wall biosynthesis